MSVTVTSADLGPAAREVYRLLGPLVAGDAAYGWASAWLLRGALAANDTAARAAADIAAVFDPASCPADLLPWLAQFVGVSDAGVSPRLKWGSTLFENADFANGTTDWSWWDNPPKYTSPQWVDDDAESFASGTGDWQFNAAGNPITGSIVAAPGVLAPFAPSTGAARVTFTYTAASAGSPLAACAQFAMLAGRTHVRQGAWVMLESASPGAPALRAQQQPAGINAGGSDSGVYPGGDLVDLPVGEWRYVQVVASTTGVLGIAPTTAKLDSRVWLRPASTAPIGATYSVLIDETRASGWDGTAYAGPQVVSGDLPPGVSTGSTLLREVWATQALTTSDRMVLANQRVGMTPATAQATKTAFMVRMVAAQGGAPSAVVSVDRGIYTAADAFLAARSDPSPITIAATDRDWHLLTVTDGVAPPPTMGKSAFEIGVKPSASMPAGSSWLLEIRPVELAALEALPAGLSETELRAAISAPEGWRRGSLEVVRLAALRYMVPGAALTIIVNSSPASFPSESPGDWTFIAAPGDVPDQAAYEAAVTAAIYGPYKPHFLYAAGQTINALTGNTNALTGSIDTL